MFDFSGQIVLVSGASRGIGRRVSQDFAAEGALVVLTSRSQADVDAVATGIKASGGQAAAMALDVADQEQVKSVVSRTLETHGPIDVLVNNAGITRDGLLMRMKDEDWRQVISVNLDGAFRLSREVVGTMIRRRYGRIVNLTSVVAQMGNPGQTNYVASKAALIGFTRALAREVAPRLITVNAVAPGFIETDMTAKIGTKAAEALIAQIPLKRIGDVADVSLGVRFLASREAGYITGHVLNINGGLYM